MQLQVSHEVNRHLNGEVEAMVLKVDTLQQDLEAHTRRADELSELLAREKRDRQAERQKAAVEAERLAAAVEAERQNAAVVAERLAATLEAEKLKAATRDAAPALPPPPPPLQVGCTSWVLLQICSREELLC